MKQHFHWVVSFATIFMLCLPLFSKAQPDFGNCPTCAPASTPTAATGQALTTSAIGAEYKLHAGANMLGARYDALQNGSSFNLGVAFSFSGKSNTSIEKGFGILVGYRYSIQNSVNGNLFAGLRTAIWFNKISSEGANKKSADIFNSVTIVQPGLEVGYQFLFSSYYVAPAISYDYGLRLNTNVSKSMYEGGKVFLGLSGGRIF